MSELVTTEGQVEDGDTETGVLGRLKTVSRLWPLGQDPHILRPYSAKEV